MNKVVQVAVAIIQKSNGEYLLASRPNGKGWAGWWEFPGGKVEANESPEHALSRELQEELGITPTRTQKWIKRRYDYPATHDAEAKTVLLHFYFVWNWQGDPRPLEGQTLAWQHPNNLNVNPILPANAPIMHALALPSIFNINYVSQNGQSAFLNTLNNDLDNGLSLMLLCTKALNRDALASLCHKVMQVCAPYACKVLLNDHIDLAQQLGMDGVHLSTYQLTTLTQKPALPLVSGTCYQTDDLAQAKRLGLDFLMLPFPNSSNSAVLAERDWAELSDLITDYEIPVYLSADIQSAQLPLALTAGARGIAILREF